MQTKEIRIFVQEYASIEELPVADGDLLAAARKIAETAYAPYSGFRVGAALLLENGRIVTGNNQENAAYPSGLCAERVALFYAHAHYPDMAVKALAVTAINTAGKIPEIVTPCGSCRQVMQETENKFQQKIRFILDGTPISVLDGISSLLPIGFHKDYL